MLLKKPKKQPNTAVYKLPSSQSNFSQKNAMISNFANNFSQSKQQYFWH